MSTSIAQWKGSLCAAAPFLSNKIAEPAQKSLYPIFFWGEEASVQANIGLFFLVQSS